MGFSEMTPESSSKAKTFTRDPLRTIAMNIDITEMMISDYDEVFALWQDAEGVGLHPDECDSRMGIATYLARNPGTCFVARRRSRLVGSVLCGNDGRRGYMNHLAVAEAYRRHGIGTALVDRCMAALAKMGIPRCNLFVYATNEGAMEFWRKLGWRCHDDFGVKAMTFKIERNGRQDEPVGHRSTSV